MSDVPDSETEYVPIGFDSDAGEVSEREVAAVALGYLNQTDILPDLLTMANESGMYVNAAALLGDFNNLNQSHFQETNNMQLQMAAVDAVIRDKGRHGLEWALNYEQSQYWYEEEFVAENIKAMLLSNPGVPVRNQLEKAKTLEDLRAWQQRDRSPFSPKTP